jgi:hypothetical protein
MVAALMHALRLGYLVAPHVQAHFAAMTVPPVALVMTFVSSSGHDKTASPFIDKDFSDGALRDVQAEIIQPRNFTLPDVEPSVAAAPSTVPESGEVRILCEVHIHQGHTGEVQAVDFGVCTGDSVWQRSLLRSIQQAARLVSPMEGGEFPPVRTLLMDTASPSPAVLARQLSEPIARR